jgi:hypothetical protein
MAWTSGTAAGHDDLLDDLKTFLTTNATLVAAGENWVAEKDELFTPRTIYNVTGTSLTGDMRGLYLNGPGLAGQDNVHVNILRYQRTGNYQNWGMAGATAFDTNQAWENQPGIVVAQLNIPIFVLTSADIDYWFIANGRRFIIICEIGGDFHVSYGGLILPYAKPSEFPYPLFVAGSTQAFDASPASALNNFYTVINAYSALFRTPNGVIYRCGNLSSIDQMATWPYYESATYLNITNNPDDSFTLLPMVFYTDDLGGNVYGEPQGCFYVSNFGTTNLLNQDIVQVGGVDHLVVQDTDDSSQNHWAAFRLE